MSSARVRRLALATLLSLAARPLAQDEGDRQASRVTPVEAVVQRTGPAVVNVCLDEPASAAAGVPAAGGARASLGSGLLIDPDGYILTDTHALPRRTGGIRVRLADGRSLPATLVNIDLSNELALLKVAARPGEPFAVARLGTSSDLMVGDTVIALGNLQGRETSVSSGVVSAVGRGSPSGPDAPAQDFIHIDAPTDAGHTGGPVLNLEGEVIGIMHVAGDAGHAGLAIPIDRVRRSLATRLLDPRLLGELVSGLEPAPGPGGRDVVAGSVASGGPAERAGLRTGDRLLALDGTPVTWEFEVNKAFLSARPGQAVSVLVGRGGERLSLDLRLERGESPRIQVWRRLGVQIVDHNRYEGVRVVRVDPTGPAWMLGLRDGDLIDGLDETLVATTQELCDSVRGLPREARVVVHVWRGRGAWSGPLILR